MSMSRDNSEIVKFFKNRTIFLTGGTGVVGKLLVEKLLRTCWDLKRIYLLMRPKRGKTPQQRFEELFDNPCFDLIKDKNAKEKVFLITGDCTQPFLGISPEDVEILKKETDCILHAAANVRFDQTLKEASHIVEATRDLLELAKHIRNLKVFVYVSTAYSNFIHSHIKEEFYRPPVTPNCLLDLVEHVDDEVLQDITPTLLGKWPNTYVYAKSVSEDLVRGANSGVPTAIVRPSTIFNTLDEPKRGWIDNPFGLAAVIFGALLGLIRSLHANPEFKLNVIPADHVCNCILAVAWKTVQEKSSRVTIYNCVGTPIEYKNVNWTIDWFYWEFPSVKYRWYKSFGITGNKFWHDLCVSSCLIPLYLINLLSFSTGKSSKSVVTRYKSMNKTLNDMSLFTIREWIFDEDNVANLWREMSEDDKKIFKFETKIHDWYQYYRDCALGLRLYVFKDPIETLPEGRKKLRLLFVLHYAVVAVMYCFLFAFVTFVLGIFY